MTLYPHFLEETILALPELTGPLLDVPTRLSDGRLAGGFGANFPALLAARKAAMEDAVFCRLRDMGPYSAKDTQALMTAYHQVMTRVEHFHHQLTQEDRQTQMAVPGVYMSALEEALGVSFDQLREAALLREQEATRIIDVAFVLYDSENQDFGQDAVWERCTLSEAISGIQQAGRAARMVPVVDGSDLCTHADGHFCLGSHAQFLQDPFRYGYALIPTEDHLTVRPLSDVEAPRTNR